MASESDQDLPPELLEKLRNLELELEDGDITQKGFEKKKASLLQQYRQDDLDCNKTEANSKEEGRESGQQHDFGPEPSAADVVDFLDYLPSPTHSPPKPETGAALMEQNHNNQRSLQTQAQTQTQSSQSQMYLQHGSHYSTAQSSVSQVQYQGYPQQQQWQQPYRPNMQGSRPDPQYYPVATASPRPTRPYDPRAVPRQSYQTGGGQLQPSPSIRHQYPYGYPAQQQAPPQSSMYRSGAPPPAPAQGHVQYRPMYTTSSPRPAPVAQHPQQSPRPVYRTGTSVMHQQQSRPMNPYVGGGYRPAPAAAPAHVRTSSLDAVHYSNARPYQHGTPRPAPQNIQGYRSIPPEGWRG